MIGPFLEVKGLPYPQGEKKACKLFGHKWIRDTERPTNEFMGLVYGRMICNRCGMAKHSFRLGGDWS